jgi:ParB family chromosome partitioning protein
MSRKALGRGLSALFNQTGPQETDLVDLGIDQIDPAETQPRTLFKEDKLDELAQSIKINGLIQPIVVRRVGDRFEIIAGERRWRAAQRAGLHKIPAIIKDVPSDGVLELSLIENLQREELNPIEEATAYKRLIERFRLTQDDIAHRIGKDRSSITNCLRLLKLPRDIQALVEDERLSMGHARALLSISSPDKQKAIASEILKKGISVRETETLVKQVQSQNRGSTAGSKGAPAESANINAAELKLKKKLGAPVRIKLSRKGGVIEIRFTSPAELSRIFDLLMQRAGH